ncbi:hypothetical protein CEUSTIGMA_g780.t1 [Chlamydomonas eustigma]|uniref:Dynamin-type G domain-containing protein n=1 Tax=Chlamydomonas eustigma TaxID=1157962 RepID=A0A250WRJ7_9CHLO|nr:hypothetical protein CEUSTIGMA_g780.t1 [Chlamydomonas eustigma]|eukprot:GAX73326.1 hypothetical protein CEUSTIGMA_g780.t1 [Chlamydomonas eustigma]
MSRNALVYDRWFQFADQDRDGRVTGKDAVIFFEKSELSREVLFKVWEMSNQNKQGYLDRLGFHKAMDIIALAQLGYDVTKENYAMVLERDGGFPLPTMLGFNEEGMPDGSVPFDEFMGPNAGNSSQFMAPATFTTAESVGAAGTSSWKKMIPGVKGSAGKESNARKPVPAKICTSITDGLKAIYFQKVKPIEEAFKFANFFSPFLTESDFDAKPSILLLGQYSTGKTTFIKSLLGRDYPGSHIGPEPTTDRFVVVYYGMDERRVPGNTLAVQKDLPYQGLQGFGTGFLSRLEGAQCPARLLEEVTIIDTPGVLSGEKQRVERNYNFVEISEWFATRSDLIFLLFDPAKLDISDEFKAVITSLRLHSDKVRVVLNKSDQIDQQQLMRVYGALMWSLGKVFKSPEVCKVYVGSFNSEAPIREDVNPYGKALFEAEHKELLNALYECPQRSCDRKINEFVKRVRACKIHMLVIGHMRNKMPSMFGASKAQAKLMETLPDIFLQVQREHHLPIGDFPDPARFKEILQAFDLLSFPKVTSAMIKQIDDVIGNDIPNLVKQFDNPW